MLYAFFWVIPRRLNSIYQRFGTHCLFHLHYLHLPACEDGTYRVFRNVGIYKSDAGELPRKKHTTSNEIIVAIFVRQLATLEFVYDILLYCVCLRLESSQRRLTGDREAPDYQHLCGLG
jgi:hypothetical protein